MTRVLAGVFVGGESRRMGGRAKGLLPAPGGGTLVERWCALLHARDAGPGGAIDVVLVGRREPYASLDRAALGVLDVIDDARAGIGPLGGLTALLERAARDGAAAVLALACDMPFVPGALVERLLGAPAAPAVAPKREGRWEPLFARYDTASVLPVARRRAAGEDFSLGRLLDEVGAAELPLGAGEEAWLHDWDSPGDIG